MRFIDLIVVMILLSLGGFSLSAQIRQIQALDKSVQKKKLERDSYIFISSSFRNAAKGKGFNSFDEWEKSCGAMWNPDFIGWEKAGDFENGGRLFLGKWSFSGKEYETYVRGQSEK